MNKSAKVSLYQQVYEYCLNRIMTGEWKKDCKLPSVRLLAEQLGVHRLTVLKALKLLKEEGYVYAKEKAGYFVGDTFGNRTKEELDTPRIHSYVLNSHLSDIHGDASKYMFSTSLIDPKLLPNRYLS